MYLNTYANARESLFMKIQGFLFMCVLVRIITNQ